MPYFISILAFFIYSTAQASCLVENVIKNEYLVVTSEDLSTSFSTKTNVESLKFKKISSSKKNRNVSSFKAGEASNLKTYLINSNSLDSLKAAFPSAQIQPNCKVQFMATPTSDPMYPFQDWYFDSLNQDSNLGLTPQREIIVAVSDTGVDINHPDLQNNLWTNTAELNGQPNIDDDNNGYVDDIYGYDFGDDDSNPKPTLNDSFIDIDHGTHVAGLVAARANNNEGVAGISLNTVKVMSLKGFKSNAPSTISDLLETIYYAVDNGAHVINASWGSEKNPEAAEIAAVNYAVQNGVAIVAAAGNDTVPASWFVPAGIKNVITVASVNSSNQLSTFSNYGDSVDFISPGGDGPERFEENLLSLSFNSSYLELKGTSMAAPLVAGLIGTLMSQDTSLTVFQAIYALKESGNTFSLSPFRHSNNDQTYIKPNLIGALNYISSTSNIPEIDHEPEDITAYARNLASSSGGSSGGCSNSLSSQSYNGSSHEGNAPLSILFILIPLISILGTKKRL